MAKVKLGQKSQRFGILEGDLAGFKQNVHCPLKASPGFGSIAEDITQWGN